MRPSALALTLGATLLAGCLGVPSTDCALDVDCAGGEVCANTRECVAAGTTHAVTLRWTVAGAPADAASCAGREQLEVAIHDDDYGDTRQYAPVLCATGRFHFDKLPTYFDRATVRVLDGRSAGSQTIPPGGGEIWFDLDAR